MTVVHISFYGTGIGVFSGKNKPFEHEIRLVKRESSQQTQPAVRTGVDMGELHFIVIFKPGVTYAAPAGIPQHALAGKNDIAMSERTIMLFTVTAGSAQIGKPQTHFVCNGDIRGINAAGAAEILIAAVIRRSDADFAAESSGEIRN